MMFVFLRAYDQDSKILVRDPSVLVIERVWSRKGKMW